MIKVYGDIMLDRWILGNAGRISPEAPVPVLLEKDQKYSIGGAANLALNLQSLNGEVSMFGCVGQDDEGLQLRKMLEETDLHLQISNSPSGLQNFHGISWNLKIFAGKNVQKPAGIFTNVAVLYYYT